MELGSISDKDNAFPGPGQGLARHSGRAGAIREGLREDRRDDGRLQDTEDPEDSAADQGPAIRAGAGPSRSWPLAAQPVVVPVVPAVVLDGWWPQVPQYVVYEPKSSGAPAA